MTVVNRASLMFRTFRVLIVGATLLLGQVSLVREALAQAPDKKCPSLIITCPSGNWAVGDRVVISAEVIGAAPDSALVYNWSTSAGVITQGQGSNSIRIDTKDIGGQSVTVTVEVGGIAGCPMIESCSLPLIEYPPPAPRFFDNYSGLTFREEKQRLNNLAAELRRKPDMTAYIVVYHQQPSFPVEMLSRIGRIRDYLIKQQAIDAERVVFADGGKRERLDFEIYLLPPNLLPHPYPIITLDKEPARKSKAKGRGRKLSHARQH